jgi:FtsP/CotA-like multicopper oxidase with cupredoxin domain
MEHGEGGEMKRGGMGRMGGGGMGMGGGMMDLSMAHPIHLHGQAFQVISRSISGDTTAYDTVKDGFINSGLKDTILIMPMERIKIIKPFHDFKGLFLYHCHNLEHEDMGMMREFSVE